MAILNCKLSFDLGKALNLQEDQRVLHQNDKRVLEGGLSKDLAKQLFNPSFADWTLICEGEQIPCHRVLLGSRSPVFSVMFEQDGFTENKTRQTIIKVNYNPDFGVGSRFLIGFIT